MLHRPCFLVIDSEHANSISSRKLVLETAKYNVLTAFSCKEAVEVLQRFPGVDAAVYNSLLQMSPGYDELSAALADHSDVRVVEVGEGQTGPVGHRVDARVDGFAPALLLEALQQMFPQAARNLLDIEGKLVETEAGQAK